jgi:hypothetical protein
MNYKKINRFFKHTVSFTVSIVIFLLFYSAPGYPREYRFTDMHLHYVNFVLESQGFKSLFDEMDNKKVKIDRAVLFGLGYAISWPDIRPERVTYYADPDTYTDNTPPMYFTKEGDYKLLREYSRLPEYLKSRIYPFLQGINVMDRNEIYYVLEMFKNHPELCGIGELLIHKGLMNNVTPLIPEGDSYAMAPIFDFAAANNFPVIFHQNIADEIPSKSAEQDQIYMKEITAILNRHPHTTFIWAHTGISRYLYVKNHIQVLERLLTAHPNLYFDISWFVWDAYIEENPEKWADLIIKFPDRFMLGSDKIGNFQSQTATPYSQEHAAKMNLFMSSKAANTGVSDEIKKYIPLLELIDTRSGGTEVSDNLASSNINRILGRISCGCKSGNPVKFPWGDGDPWKDKQYALATAVLKVNNNNGNPIPMAITSDYKNLKETIAGKYFRWDIKYDYSGTVNSLTIPGLGEKLGVIVFNDPNFKKYAGIREVSVGQPFPAASLILVENWGEAFSYKGSNKLLFPNGNWPTLPWWHSDTPEHGAIDKVIVPYEKVLVLYDDEYYRGEEIGRIPWTHGRFVDLGRWGERIKSFQFIPAKSNDPQAKVSR